MYWLFNALLVPLYGPLGLYTLHRRYIKKKSAASFAGQWGHISPQMREFGEYNGPKIWLHAVSVGETMAARPIARALKTAIPGLRIALSSTTDTGHEVAQGALKAGEVDCLFFFPLDLPFIVNRVLGALRPKALCFVETELWPNLLHLARQRGIATFQVNGRVSDNLLQSAPRLGPLWRWLSGNMGMFLMRGESDAARLRTLSVPDAKIKVTGDVKLEAPPVESATLRHQWRSALEIGDAKLLIAGSTHPGEEELVLRAAQAANIAAVAIAPRHVERANEVTELIQKAGYEVRRRSRGEAWMPGSVYLLDTVGELSDFYAAGDVAFVGGSLIPRGGHNVLEPILRDCPVVFGPHMMNFRAAQELVEKHQLGTCIAEENAFAGALSTWLYHHNRSEFIARATIALEPHRGAAARMAHLVAAQISI